MRKKVKGLWKHLTGFEQPDLGEEDRCSTYQAIAPLNISGEVSKNLKIYTSANTGIFANSHSKSTVGLTFFIESSIDFVKLFSVGALHFQGWICDMGIDGYFGKHWHFRK